MVVFYLWTCNLFVRLYGLSPVILLSCPISCLWPSLCVWFLTPPLFIFCHCFSLTLFVTCLSSFSLYLCSFYACLCLFVFVSLISHPLSMSFLSPLLSLCVCVNGLVQILCVAIWRVNNKKKQVAKTENALEVTDWKLEERTFLSRFDIKHYLIDVSLCISS